MGARLIGFYEQVAKEFGVPGRVKLAILTGTTSTAAETQPDSPENIKKFEQALAQLRQMPKP